MRVWLGFLVVCLTSIAGAEPWLEALDERPNFYYRGHAMVSHTAMAESVVQFKAKDPDSQAALGVLAERIGARCQVPPARIRETSLYHGRPVLRVGWCRNLSPFDKELPSAKQPTAYRILISTRGVVVQARNDEGLLRACRLLAHILEATPGGQVQRMLIDDWRDFVPEAGKSEPVETHPNSAAQTLVPQEARTGEQQPEDSAPSAVPESVSGGGE